MKSPSIPLTFNYRISKLQNEERKQRNYQNLKPTYETMKWKKYAMQRPRNLSSEEIDRLSARNSARQILYEPYCYQPQNRLSQKKLRQQKMPLSGAAYNKRKFQPDPKEKQDAIRRVKLLQQKVLPLISNEKKFDNNRNQDYGFTWQLKTEQKLIKIQNSIEKVKNQIQIKYEKRLIQIEREWEDKINNLLELVANKTNQTEESNNEEIAENYQMSQKCQTGNSKPQYNYYQSGFDVAH